MSRKSYTEEKMKKYVYIFSVTLLISIIVFISLFVEYNKKLKETAYKELSKLNKESEIVDNKELEDFKETSYSKDATIESSNINKTNIKANNNAIKKETKKDINNNSIENAVNQENVSREDVNTIDTNQNIVQNSNLSENAVLNFVAPVSGEIIKDFSVDTLVFSNTL